jgi:peroxiredoxin
VRDQRPRIRDLGAELIVVGNGRPEHARDFKEQHGLTFPLLVDPDLEAYAAAGLRRDLRSTFNLRTVGNAVRALRGGHRQTSVQGDPWQQGGAFVITPDGRVVYEQISRAAGDHPDPAEIIAALQGLRGGGR